MAAKSSSIRVVARPRWFSTAVMLLLVGVAGAGFLGFQAFQGTEPNPPLGYGLMALGVVLAGVVVVGFARLREELTVDHNGIERNARGAITKISWSEPHDYFYVALDSSGGPATNKATLRASDGRRVDLIEVIQSDSSVVRVPAVVEQFSTKSLWPRVQKQLEEGQEVAFGPIVVDSKSVRFGETKFSRAEPLSVRVTKGEIQVGVGGEWQSTATQLLEVPNYPTFLRAIGQITQARAPG